MEAADPDDEWFKRVRELNEPNSPLAELTGYLEQALSKLGIGDGQKSRFTSFGRNLKWIFDKKDVVNRFSRMERL